jgi:dihydropteroate synthase
MGILNVTPDSFSDGGRHADTQAAIEAGLAMARAGAALIDIGGESTRPGSMPTPPEVEQARILPVIRALAAAGLRLSVDTRHAATMAAALDAGAEIINDVSGATFDPATAELLARRGCPVVLMHMRGVPATMAQHAVYGDVAVEVVRELAARVAAAQASGIRPERIAVDPGIGFAKTPAQSALLLQRLALFANLGLPILVGLSRKRFLAALTGEAAPRERGPASLAGALFALARGAGILRVHDVAETVQAVGIWQGLSLAASEAA